MVTFWTLAAIAVCSAIATITSFVMSHKRGNQGLLIIAYFLAMLTFSNVLWLISIAREVDGLK